MSHTRGREYSWGAPGLSQGSWPTTGPGGDSEHFHWGLHWLTLWTHVESEHSMSPSTCSQFEQERLTQHLFSDPLMMTQFKFQQNDKKMLLDVQKKRKSPRIHVFTFSMISAIGTCDTTVDLLQRFHWTTGGPWLQLDFCEIFHALKIEKVFSPRGSFHFPWVISCY